MSEVQFLKWKNSIQQMWVEESKLREQNLKLGLMEKDLEIAKLKHMIFRNSIQDQVSKVNDTKKAYEDGKAALESELGMSLNNCAIDEVSYEIRNLEGEENGSN